MEPRFAAALGATLLLVAGCVDPAGDLDAFQKRLVHAPPADAGPDTGSDSAGCGISPGFIQGQYLLTISVSIAPSKPLLALADVTTPAFQGGTGIALTAQALSATDRTTPVDSPVSFGPFAVGSDGTFRAELSGLTVSGGANPITPGAAISSNLVLVGNLCAHDGLFCGAASGQATSPINLDLSGSTFTLTPPSEAGTFPVQPTIDCKGTLADPL